MGDIKYEELRATESRLTRAEHPTYSSRIAERSAALSAFSRVLIVDDDAPLRRVLSRFFRTHSPEMVKTTKVIQSAEKSLGSEGRVLVRWSGTEPKLRVMVEGPNASTIKTLAKNIATTAEQELRA